MQTVSVEESKAQRLQRQLARFRDRGGAFVPSEKNPLVDILLARTITGESPSKAIKKSPYRHRSRSVSPSKAKRKKAVTKLKASTVKISPSKAKAEPRAESVTGNIVATPSTESGGKIAKTETSKKAGPTRKGKGKTKATDGDNMSEGENVKTKRTPKRKGRPRRTKTQVADLDNDANSEPAKPKAGTSKAKPPDKSKAKAKSVEEPHSDDEGTLVEAPRSKAYSKRKPVIVTIDSETVYDSNPDMKIANVKPSLLSKSAYKRSSTKGKDAPLDRIHDKKRTHDREEQSDEVGTTQKHSQRVESNVEYPNVVKTKTYGSLTVEIPEKKSPYNSKRSAPDELVGESAKELTKKARVKNQSPKYLSPFNCNATSKPNAEGSAPKKTISALKNTKRKKERPPESDDEDHLPKKPLSKKARFEEESKPAVQISSHRQKENILQSRKPRVGKPASKPKSRGPPKDILDRIKASATLHRVADDSEPDPLDCLS